MTAANPYVLWDVGFQLSFAATLSLILFTPALERLLEPWETQAFESIAMDRARTLTRMGERREAEGAWHAIALEVRRTEQVQRHTRHGRPPFGSEKKVRSERFL